MEKLDDMDIIFLRGLEVETTIGIYDWERKIKQVVVIDLEMGTDIRKAATSDSIEDTIDYKTVSKNIIAFVEDSQFLLVETLAEKIAEIVLAASGTNWLRLTVNKKGAIRGAVDVGVIIERGEKV
jgi:dihydroneopterin aldolase